MYWEKNKRNLDTARYDTYGEIEDFEGVRGLGPRGSRIHRYRACFEAWAHKVHPWNEARKEVLHENHLHKGCHPQGAARDSSTAQIPANPKTRLPETPRIGVRRSTAAIFPSGRPGRVDTLSIPKPIEEQTRPNQDPPLIGRRKIKNPAKAGFFSEKIRCLITSSPRVSCPWERAGPS